MAKRAYVPYCGDRNNLVIVKLPSWAERHLWWPLAWKLTKRQRSWLWNRAYSWEKQPGHSIARWLTTHTPWWGGPGIGRPELHNHIVGKPF